MDLVTSRTQQVVSATNEIHLQLEKIKASYASIARKTASAIDKLADDVDLLAQLAQSQPAISELITMTYIKMAKAAELLAKANQRKNIYNILPVEVLELFGGTEHYNVNMEKHSKYLKCNRQGPSEFDLEFSTLSRSDLYIINIYIKTRRFRVL